MTNVMEIYKCQVCGIIVEVVHGGAGHLVCCGQPMKPCKENTVDAAVEKHVPVIERTGSGVSVKVGKVPHPMTAEHYIEWVELVADGKTCRQVLKPGDAPEALFQLAAEKVGAREYCSLHGLWKGE
jgi:superoxide reductase